MKLEFLDMSYSNVYEIEYFPVSLKYLHLTNNNIHPGYFSFGHIDRMHNLKKLDLSDQFLEVADSITPLKKELIQTSEVSSDQHWRYKVLSVPFNNITKTIYINLNKTTQNVKITTRNMTFKDWGFNAENRFAK